MKRIYLFVKNKTNIKLSIIVWTSFLQIIVTFLSFLANDMWNFNFYWLLLP